MSPQLIRWQHVTVTMCSIWPWPKEGQGCGGHLGSSFSLRHLQGVVTLGQLALDSKCGGDFSRRQQGCFGSNLHLDSNKADAATANFSHVFEWFTLEATVTMVIFHLVCPWPLRWWVCHHAGPPGCGCCRWWGWGTGSEPEAAVLTGASVCKVRTRTSQAILSVSPQCIHSRIFSLKLKNLCSACAV